MLHQNMQNFMLLEAIHVPQDPTNFELSSFSSLLILESFSYYNIIHRKTSFNIYYI